MWLLEWLFGWSVEWQTLMALMQEGATWQDLYANDLLRAFCGTAVFGVLGMYYIHRMNKKIEREGAGGVSVIWTLHFLALFTSFAIAGVYGASFAILFQCCFRVPWYIKRTRLLYEEHVGFKLAHRLFGGALLIPLALTFVWPAVVSTVMLWLGVAAAAAQPYKMWNDGKTQGFDIWEIVVYLLSSGFWYFYGAQVEGGWHIQSWAAAYALVYICMILVYVRTLWHRRTVQHVA